ncbi:hypothetical protein AOLI_G00071410 [Acnodon oligacanthus]
MSCLWFWCCRVHERKEERERKEEQSETRKRKEGKEQEEMEDLVEERKEDQLEESQQPVKVEEEADALNLPVGLVSGSLKSVSAERLENTAPPLQENLTGGTDETIKHLMKTLLDDVEANVEQLLINLVSRTDDKKPLEPLEKQLDNLVSNTEDKTGIASELMEIQLDKDVSASVQHLEN